MQGRLDVNNNNIMIFLTQKFLNPILPRSLKWMFVPSSASSLTRTQTKTLREHLAVEDTTKNWMMPPWSVWKVKSMLTLQKACFDFQKNWKLTRRPLGLPFMKILVWSRMSEYQDSYWHQSWWRNVWKGAKK